MSLLSRLYKEYWSIGYTSHLYDLLTPESYTDSIKKSLRNLDLGSCDSLLDLGCGSGLTINHLESWLMSGGQYHGVDGKISGLKSCRRKANLLDASLKLDLVLADMSQRLPFKKKSLDACIAHFSINCLVHSSIRKRLYLDLFDVMKPGSRLVVNFPSRDYCPKTIIDESFDILQESSGRGDAVFKKFLVYPFTYYLGLRHIQSQLQSGELSACNRSEIVEEISKGGFNVIDTELVYANSAWMVTAIKPESL